MYGNFLFYKKTFFSVHYQCVQIHPINCSTLPMFTNISNKQQYTTNVYKYTWETAVHYQCLQIYPINSSTLPMFTNIPDKLEYTITVKKKKYLMNCSTLPNEYWVPLFSPKTSHSEIQRDRSCQTVDILSNPKYLSINLSINQ